MKTGHASTAASSVASANTRAGVYDDLPIQFESAFDEVLRFIELASEVGLDAEATAVVVPGFEISKVEKPV